MPSTSCATGRLRPTDEREHDRGGDEAERDGQARRHDERDEAAGRQQQEQGIGTGHVT